MDDKNLPLVNTRPDDKDTVVIRTITGDYYLIQYSKLVEFLGNGASSSIGVLLDAATVTINATNQSRLRLTLTDGVGGTRILANPTGMTDGKSVVLELTQGGTGNKAITFDTKYNFGSDILSATLSTTAGKTDYLQLLYNASRDKFDVVSFIKGY